MDARLAELTAENMRLLVLLIEITERLRGDPRYQDLVQRIDAFHDGEPERQPLQREKCILM